MIFKKVLEVGSEFPVMKLNFVSKFCPFHVARARNIEYCYSYLQLVLTATEMGE